MNVLKPITLELRLGRVASEALKEKEESEGLV